jgi:hypothetical protein
MCGYFASFPVNPFREFTQTGNISVGMAPNHEHAELNIILKDEGKMKS